MYRHDVIIKGGLFTRAGLYTVFCDIPVLMHGPVWFLLYLLYRYLNVWFVKCDTQCVTSIFIVYFSTGVISLHSPYVAFHTDLATPPVTQGEHLMFLNHETLEFILHGQCNIHQCTTVDDNDAVVTLLLNINLLAFYNYTISLCFLHMQTDS